MNYDAFNMSPIAIAYAITAGVSIAMLLAAWRRPRVGRLLFAVMFFAAGLFNGVTALRTPQVYVHGFGRYAVGPYRSFIEGPFAVAPGVFVLAIAAGQLLVALGITFGRGLLFKAGVAGAVVFLLAISGLGVGAAFPLNLVLAAGAVLLMRSPSRPAW